jgi:DNA-binding NarL/FixJ family response regulator
MFRPLPETASANEVRVISRHPLVLRYLSKLISKCAGKSTSFELIDSRALTSTTTNTLNIIIIIDLAAIPCSADLVVKLLRANPRRRLLAILNSSDFSDSHIYRLLCLGVEGVVRADESIETELPKALAAMFDDQVWIPQQLLTRYTRETKTLRWIREAPTIGLTAREGQVLEILLRGFSNKEIASVVRTSERTVKYHVSNIFRKLGVGKRTELVGALKELSSDSVLHVPNTSPIHSGS